MLSKKQKIEEVRQKINNRFPGVMVNYASNTVASPDILAGLPVKGSSSLHEHKNFNSFNYLTGWPFQRSSSLLIKGQGATFFVWKLMQKTLCEFNEAVAYVDGRTSFFPPGAAYSGIDLDFIFWVNTDNVPCSVRAAEHLVSSNLFGLVILDPPAGSAIATGCRRLHLKLLHSSSRLLVIDHSDTDMSVTVHRKLFLSNVQPRWNNDSSNCGIASFEGIGQPAVSYGRQFLSSVPFSTNLNW